MFSRWRSFAALLAASLTVLVGSVALAAPSSAYYRAPGCGNEVVYKANGMRWTCTFDDEFNGNSLNTSNWTPQVTAESGFTNGGECYINSPNNITVANGMLALSVRREAAPFNCTDPFGNFTTQYTSGMVSTYGHFSQTYGRFEIRAMLPAATIAGLQESFWLWPVNASRYGAAWPASGEIDIAEMYSQYPSLAIPYVHYNEAGYDPNATSDSCTITPGQFHTFVATWTSSSIAIAHDGTTCLVDTWNPAAPLNAPEPFDQPFMLSLTQALGLGANAPSAATPLPATTYVDYVRIWR